MQRPNTDVGIGRDQRGPQPFGARRMQRKFLLRVDRNIPIDGIEDARRPNLSLVDAPFALDHRRDQRGPRSIGVNSLCAALAVTSSMYADLVVRHVGSAPITLTSPRAEPGRSGSLGSKVV